MQRNANRCGAAVVQYHGERGRSGGSSTPTPTAAGHGDGRRGARRLDAQEGRSRTARAARPRRAEGLPQPERMTFGPYARTWLEQSEKRRGWKPSTRGRGGCKLVVSVSGSRRRRSGRSSPGMWPSTSTSAHRGLRARDHRRRPRRLLRGDEAAKREELIDSNPVDGVERRRSSDGSGASSSPSRSLASARRSPSSSRGGVPDARPDRHPALRAAGAPLARRRPRRGRPARRRLEDRGGRPLDRALTGARRGALAVASRDELPGRRRARVLQPGHRRRVPRGALRRGVPGRAQGRRHRPTTFARSTICATRRSRTTPPPGRARSR